MGCLRLTYREESEQNFFCGLWKKSATEENCDNYYPYGLTAFSWLREGESENKFLYQGKELITQTGWQDFGARMYDGATGRWFVVDPAGQFSSPYVGMGNNPVFMIDPDGRLAWFVPVIIGAVIGGYQGYQLGQANHASGWDMFGYILGGAVIGGASGYLGYGITEAGGVFANTAAIAASSSANSFGMKFLSGGKSPFTTSFGAFSVNWESGDVDYFGKSGNSTLENFGYGLGALANIQDIVAGANGTDVVVKARKKLGGHSETKGTYTTTTTDAAGNVTTTSEDISISVGPLSGHGVTAATQKIGGNLGWEWEFVRRQLKGITTKAENVSYIRSGQAQFGIKLNNVNGKWLANMTERLNNGRNLINGSRFNYGLLYGCVNYNARALFGVGVLNVNALLPITSPVFLNFELVVRQMGMYASPYLTRH